MPSDPFSYEANDHLTLLKIVDFLQRSFRGASGKNLSLPFKAAWLNYFIKFFKEYKHKFLNVFKSNHLITWKNKLEFYTINYDSPVIIYKISFYKYLNIFVTKAHLKEFSI